MLGVLRSGIKYRQATRRSIALVFLLCFIVASLFSSAFIIIHASHEHDHNGVSGSCAVCAQIQVAENLLRQPGITVAITLAAFIGLLTVIASVHIVLSSVGSTTPVELKIRMNN